MSNPKSKIAWQKTPLKIVDIIRTDERVIEVLLEDGRPVPIRRDLVEIFGDTIFVPEWLAAKINPSQQKQSR